MPVSPEDAEDLAAEVTQAYSQAETSVLARIAKFIGIGLDSDSWSTSRRNGTGAVRRAIASLLGKYFTRGRRAAARAATEAERRGVAAANDELGADHSKGSGSPSGAHAKEGLQAMLKDLKVVEKAVSTQAMTAYQRIITEVTQGVTNGTTTRLNAAQRALDRFANEGITGFVDKAGRNWEIATYVEMAIRTHAANIMVSAHIDRLAEVGITLVQVSEAPYECELCSPWEGKILEVGGKSGPHTVKVTTGGKTVSVDVDGSLEDARASGLFHPNCRHNIEGYVPGASSAPTKADTKTTYADTQKQRALERAARKWDRRRAVALDDDERKLADAKFKEYRARIRTHVAKTGLPRKSNRERHDTAR